VSAYKYALEPFSLEFDLEKPPSTGQLNAWNVKVGEEKIFGAKVDIASIKSIATFTKNAHELYPEAFPEDDLELRRAINQLNIRVKDGESARRAKAEEDDEKDEEDVVAANAPEEGSDEHAAAMRILKSKDILGRAARAMHRLGHVGEWENKKLAFACALSARAQLPIQPSTHAESSAGKNYLWDKVLGLMPDELVYRRTGFSAKALFRTQMSLKHSVLYIQEVQGTEGAEFSIRTLQSDGVLRWEATEKDENGSPVNVEYEVEGPCVIVQTTTRNHLHPENETRVVPLYLDESAVQTERITKQVLRRAAGQGALPAEEEQAIYRDWQNAVRLLKPAEVVIPYAERIEFPSQPIRVRRDVPRLISIIKLVAWLHQYSRERDALGRIQTTEKDFKTALRIVGDSFSRAWKMLTPAEEAVLRACQVLSKHVRLGGFKKSNVEKAIASSSSSISQRRLQDHLKALADSGYLDSDYAKGPAGATYKISGTHPISSVVTLSPAPSRISEKQGEIGIGKANIMRNYVSRIARISEEEAQCGESAKSVRALESEDLQEKEANARKREEKAEEQQPGEEDVEYEFG
jgi:hypothetical protein